MHDFLNGIHEIRHAVEYSLLIMIRIKFDFIPQTISRFQIFILYRPTFLKKHKFRLSVDFEALNCWMFGQAF